MGFEEIINQNWHYWSTGLLEHYQNPDSIPIKTYERMKSTDETVKFGLKFITLTALSMLGEYSHKEQKIQDFIRENFEKMRGNLYFGLKEILSGLWAGYSVTEICYGIRDGRIVLDQLQTLHPDTITFDIEKDGPNKNNLKSVIQYLGQSNEVSLEPANKRIVYTYDKQFGNIYGSSILKGAYKNWFIKDEILKYWSKAMSKYASPIPIIKALGLDASIVIDGKTMTKREYYKQALEQFDTGKGFTIEKDSEEIQLESTVRYLSTDFLQFIEYLNKMILRAILLPSLVGDNDKVGSYSLGKKHFDIFLLAGEDILTDLTETLLEQIIRPLIELNFGVKDDYGEWPVEEINDEDLKALSETFLNAVNTGYVSPENIEDMNHMRTKTGFNEVKEGEISFPTPQLLRTQPDLQGQPEDTDIPDQDQEKQKPSQKAKKSNLKEVLIDKVEI